LIKAGQEKNSGEKRVWHNGKLLERLGLPTAVHQGKLTLGGAKKKKKLTRGGWVSWVLGKFLQTWWEKRSRRPQLNKPRGNLKQGLRLDASARKRRTKKKKEQEKKPDKVQSRKLKRELQQRGTPSLWGLRAKGASKVPTQKYQKKNEKIEWLKPKGKNKLSVRGTDFPFQSKRSAEDEG